MKIDNLAAATEILNTYISPGRTKYTLDNMRALMQFLGNPQNKLRVIHVAGTSGKTSISYYIAGLLHYAGYNVGLTVSPHIMAVNERVQIDLQPLAEKQFCKLLGEFVALVDTSGVKPSYFELLVAFAYWTFDKLEVDYAVVEVGLGGLLDGTNVVDTPDKVCVITDIGLDHVEILGNDIASVAAQKAGIIHPGNQVFMQTQDPVAVEIVSNTCQKIGATAHITAETNLGFELPAFQNRNLSLARTVASFVIEQEGGQLIPGVLERAASIVVPGRMEYFEYRGRNIIIDGAHNAQKTEALVRSIKGIYPNTKMAVMVSFGNNKTSSFEESLRLLREVCDEIIITEFDSSQDEYRKAMRAQELAETARNIGYPTVMLEASLNKALNLLVSKSEGPCLVTGSLYLVSQVRAMILGLENISH